MNGPRKLLSREPWCFKLGAWLNHRKFRGGTRLINTAERFGLLNAVVRYKLDDRLAIDVPLFREANRWTKKDVINYERTVLEYLARIVNQTGFPVSLVDCGADIGIFSLMCYSRIPSIIEITAFEPNKEAFAFLTTNLGRLPCEVRCIDSAVSDYSGKGELKVPDYDSSDHARYLAPSPSGTIDVTKVDDQSVDTSGTVIIKIDVEGEELNVIRGSARTIAGARSVVVIFEAHPSAVQRTGIDPIECMKQLGAFRDFHYAVAEMPDTRVELDRPFFEQFPPHVLNVACFVP